MVQPSAMRIRFGDLELDEERLLLRRRGERLAIRPKVFDLLVHLVAHRERVVRREELLLKLWGRTAVGSGSLAGLVNELRQILGEAGRGPSSIRTVHARGYQFVAEVEFLAPTEAEGIAPEALGRIPIGHAPKPARPDPIRSRAMDTIGIQASQVETGGARCVLVGGLPGSDRSELLDRASRWIWQNGFEVHRVGRRPSSPPSDLQRQDLAARILGALIERHGVDTLRKALPGRMTTLLARSRRLERGVPIRPRDPLAARQIDEEVWRGTAELLRAVARHSPLALVIDDIDGSGDELGVWIPFLLRVLGKTPLFLLGNLTGTAVAEVAAWAEDPADPRIAVVRSGEFEGVGPKSAAEPSGPPVLPAELTERLAAHVRDDPARLATLVAWLEAGQTGAIGVGEPIGRVEEASSSTRAEAEDPPRERRMLRVESGRSRSRVAGQR